MEIDVAIVKSTPKFAYNVLCVFRESWRDIEGMDYGSAAREISLQIYLFGRLVL
jgi:hypothetical protein